ncbi:hypothetical protein dsat_1353 [Alkalidesulfovibrio alkalitolerans DSM 16529]|jgi:hypothetical protein|uniref:Uncharacterized protein n=1 Tax=Alkalidesulfovibrio alkalitolerans DSM 16529 TaxID=1121439 RepID=S7T225_9BACT|nr:hypothetical protein dsat_1353 [Alkalidesulfovibrio alkalitolerans DSM 16529]
MGYSRQQFYEIRRNFQSFGADGLLDRLPGARGPHPNRVDEAVEKAILDYSRDFPTHGPLRVAQQLVLQGVQVSSGGVRVSGAATTCSPVIHGSYGWSVSRVRRT